MKTNRIKEIEQSIQQVVFKTAEQNPQYHRLLGALGEHGDFDLVLSVKEKPKKKERD